MGQIILVEEFAKVKDKYLMKIVSNIPLMQKSIIITIILIN